MGLLQILSILYPCLLICAILQRMAKNPLGCNRQMKDVLKAVHKAGWRYEDCTHGIMVYPPNGVRPIPLHRSNRGGRRKTPNAIVQLRRAGLDI